MSGISQESQTLRIRELDACKRVLESGDYVLGPEVKSFEAAWAKACGATEAVGVANGLDAIEISLRALGIGAGDEVITSPMTAFATALGIIRAGATPVFADIDLATGLLSLESAESCISKSTKAILLVHLYGQVRDMDEWVSLVERYGIELIEDCAQSHLAQSQGRFAGTFGRIGAYSFYPTKNLGAIGDAGAIVTSDTHLAQYAAQLRNYGQSERYVHTRVGLNSRLDELQAALLLERLPLLEGFTQRRRSIANRYNCEIKNESVDMLSPPKEKSAHSYHLFVIRVRGRDKFEKHLSEAGIQTLKHYPVPLHLQPAIRDPRVAPTGLSASEVHADTCISIPCHPQLCDDDVSKVIATINGYEG